MYAFPLTIYLLTHWIGIPIPLNRISGNLMRDLITYLGLGNGWFIVMLVCNGPLIFGIWLIMVGREEVYDSEGQFVTNGVCSYVRDPQNTFIYLITLAFMIQWPTLTPLLLWPFVIGIYYRLARQKKQIAIDAFGDRYRKYMEQTPIFFPLLFRRCTAVAPDNQ
ncbi:MAG: hypothetical protein CMJ58_16140 [Planctomycetaceae bacterium]|nr:hypothetical protein [Planctomycetaceae bacterium]